MNKKYVAITIGIMCFLLTLGIVVQLNTIKEATATVGENNNKNELRDDVLKWKERYDYAFAQLTKEKEDLETKRKEATKNDANSEQLEEELKTANKLLGQTDVTGKGIIITVADSNKDIIQNLENVNTMLLLVHSTDIVQIVNELKNAGAEAISVNDQRIVLTTSITCDGNVILINGQKIGSPFVIKAIGYPATLLGLKRPGGFLEIMQSEGIDVSIKQSDNITIKKYDGVLSSKYLKNAN